MIQASELVLNPDNSVYHLKLHPEEIADTVLLVGDPARVSDISKYFNTIDVVKQNREFVTHTGWYEGTRITAMSTGMGTDNIDIVVTELDILVNFDIEKREEKKTKKQLNIIRLGTSGGLQPEIPIGSFLVSSFAIGLDGLLNFYQVPDGVLNNDMSECFVKHCNWSEKLPYPYAIKANEKLRSILSKGNYLGITATAPGFYGPQGREVRLRCSISKINDYLQSFVYNDMHICNFEMETSALYGLSALLGHKTCTICTIIANRVTKEFCNDYHPYMNNMIKMTLERICKNV